MLKLQHRDTYLGNELILSDREHVKDVPVSFIQGHTVFELQVDPIFAYTMLHCHHFVA